MNVLSYESFVSSFISSVGMDSRMDSFFLPKKIQKLDSRLPCVPKPFLKNKTKKTGLIKRCNLMFPFNVLDNSNIWIRGYKKKLFYISYNTFCNSHTLNFKLDNKWVWKKQNLNGSILGKQNFFVNSSKFSYRIFLPLYQFF